MNFDEAITELNILRSYDTSEEKSKKIKECINVFLREHNAYEVVKFALGVYTDPNKPVVYSAHDSSMLSQYDYDVLKKAGL